MTGSTYYLEQYLDSLEDLPTELKNKFSSMKERTFEGCFTPNKQYEIYIYILLKNLLSSLKCSNVFNEQSLFLLSNGQKNFIASSLMFIYVQELDIRNRDIMVSIDSASDEYLRKVRDLSPSKRKQEKVNF